MYKNLKSVECLENEITTCGGKLFYGKQQFLNGLSATKWQEPKNEQNKIKEN